MISNVEKVEELNKLLKEFNLTSTSEVKSALAEISSQEERTKELLPITSEILSNLGITSIDEWREAMQDKDLAAMFDHASVPSTEMFMAASIH